jgi:hypothetical protein
MRLLQTGPPQDYVWRFTEQWMIGSLSNYTYLMSLNLLSGRSFNDLSQYPVLPWVLADYSSPTLDLANPQTFRDLSKPIGALNDPSNFSNPFYVLHYLVRVEPFTSLHISLCDHKFDSVSRTFSSISHEFNTDFRELIPEFFTFPEFLINSNGFDLGSGIDDVILPPWAGGSAHAFIARHRTALESSYVSAHLPAWIDLMFGFRSLFAVAHTARTVLPRAPVGSLHRRELFHLQTAPRFLTLAGDGFVIVSGSAVVVRFTRGAQSLTGLGSVRGFVGTRPKACALCGYRLATTSLLDDTVHVFEIGPRALMHSAVVRQRFAPIAALTHAGGTFLLAAARDSSLTLWDLEDTRQPLFRTSPHRAAVVDVDVAPELRLIASVDDSGNCALSLMPSGRLGRVFQVSAEGIVESVLIFTGGFVAVLASRESPSGKSSVVEVFGIDATRISGVRFDAEVCAWQKAEFTGAVECLVVALADRSFMVLEMPLLGVRGTVMTPETVVNIAVDGVRNAVIVAERDGAVAVFHFEESVGSGRGD